LSGKRILSDEAELSAVNGQPVASVLLKTSAISGKRAEPQHFGTCEFTAVEVLNTELATSEASGRRYRADQQVRSVVSDKAGHRQEFVHCHETRQPLLPTEGERCEATRKLVRPGILEQCAVKKAGSSLGAGSVRGDRRKGAEDTHGDQQLFRCAVD
jgi:hypothetical protein